MKRIAISADRDYEVIIGTDYKVELCKVTEGYQRVALIYSQAMEDQIPKFEDLESEILRFPIPDSEEAKSSRSLIRVWDWLGAAGFTRSDLIIAIGGGAVTDFAGFAAASWLRGIDWIAVPTTLAGMVDAAVGGKTGINSDYGKNLIGAFHSPKSVIIDAQWLDSLGDRDFSAGLAEVVKCGFIQDREILSVCQENSLAEIRASKALTMELIERSVAVKASVVSTDFTENFDREILNYGHTFGHAVELDAKYSLRHGECVSIGMVFIAELAVALGKMNQELLDLHLTILKNLNLPVSYRGSSWPALHANMKLDKKSRGDTLRFVIVTEIGQTQRLEGPTELQLHGAYEKVCS